MELANEIALENYRARFDWAFGVGSQGFTEERLLRAPGDRAGRRRRPGSQVRPVAGLRSLPVPPLITREEALRLGELEDRAEIEALVERAWRVRVERFGDSTDMCSLVNAKSGGCAEDCGFCAQSRFAEADTPMHAMMEPDQILEHARAAEAAGAHRFCMVTQGQGLSKRDFEKVLEGARLVAEHTNLKRCVSIGHMSRDARPRAQGGRHPARAPQRRDRREPTTTRSRPRSATRAGCARSRRCARPGLETCVGGILNLGESREQRVEMAFELAAIDPTSVPINLLNPRPGTKFGDRELHGPVGGRSSGSRSSGSILPDALFRLCGGRVENLGELQPLAVKAGLNGVMMGNFLTTLGYEPEEDRAMFEELGLNVARQEDNGATRGRTTARAGSTARRRRRRSTSLRTPGRGELLGPGHPAPAPQEALGAARPDGAPNRGRPRSSRPSSRRSPRGPRAAA